MVYYPIITKKSLISGMGVFSTKNINAGERIYFIDGEEVSLSEIVNRINKNIEESGDSLQIDDEIYIDLNEISRCFNHSCNPNSFIRNKNELIALKDITEGEEITFDYSTTMWETKDKLSKFEGAPWIMQCNCGSKSCRKIIDQFYLLPIELQKFYLKNKLVPDLILKKHSEIRNQIDSLINISKSNFQFNSFRST